MPIIAIGLFIVLCMGILSLVRKYDLLRKFNIADMTLPQWVVFTPIVLPVFIVGACAIITLLSLKVVANFVIPENHGNR